MLYAMRMIAERKITEAIEQGRLNPQGWKNRPLPRENDGFVPADLKMAYKILKNGGFLPPEIETRKEIDKLEDLIAATEDGHTRVKQLKKLDVLLMRLSAQRGSPLKITEEQDYYRRLVERVTVRQQT